MSDATDRIKRNSARGLSFWKMVGIHLSAVPEEQAFIEAARKEHKDLNIIANDVVTNQGRGAKSIWTWDDPNTRKTRATIHTFADKVNKTKYPPGTTLDVEGTAETG